MRKTIDVVDVVEIANRMLRAEASTKGQREGVISLVESILHATENYRGYNYQNSEHAVPGDPVAVGTTRLRVGFDETRRFYYGSGS